MSFPNWVISRSSWEGTARVLDIGCGTGSYAPIVAGRLTSGSYVGLDNSVQLIQQARRAMRGNKKIVFEIADAHKLPFYDSSFDMIMANHVLYHLEVDGALHEISRVLDGRGTLIAATNSERTMPELDMIHRKALGVRLLPSPFRRFSMESGQNILSNFFENVHVHKFEDTLKFRRVNSLLDYYSSGWVYRTSHGRHDLWLNGTEIRRRCEIVSRHVKRIIVKKGLFELHKTSCVFIATNPKSKTIGIFQ